MNEQNCKCDVAASKSVIEELKERIESLEKNHHLNYIEKRFHELYKFTDEQVKFTFNLPNKPYHDLKERIETLESNHDLIQEVKRMIGSVCSENASHSEFINELQVRIETLENTVKDYVKPANCLAEEKKINYCCDFHEKKDKPYPEVLEQPI